MFRLVVTPPARKHEDPEPYEVTGLPNRSAVGMAAVRELSKAGFRFGLPGSGRACSRPVQDAELGVTVTHEESGYTFRTEEF